MTLPPCGGGLTPSRAGSIVGMTTVRTRPGTSLLTRLARPRQLAGDVLAIGRPWFWFVSLVPFYLGVVLATEPGAKR